MGKGLRMWGRGSDYGERGSARGEGAQPSKATIPGPFSLFPLPVGQAAGGQTPSTDLSPRHRTPGPPPRSPFAPCVEPPGLALSPVQALGHPGLCHRPPGPEPLSGLC